MSPEVFHLIHRIQILTAKLAQNLLSGFYRSAFKGKGMEFEEAREYQSGDDLRSIDWKVTARMNHPYVKVFREERELTVMLMVDISASTRFGSKHKGKKDLIVEIGALLAFSAVKNNDNVGLILFSDRIEKYIPPRKSLRHIIRVIRELVIFHPQDTGTDVSEALNFLGKVQAKPCICFLISDFQCGDFSRQAELISIKHDLIGISITDPFEVVLPNVSLVELEDFESNRHLVLDSASSESQQFATQAAEKRIAACKKLFQNIGAGFIDLRTDAPYLSVIQNFLKQRSQHPK